jgi:hypothetical protein
MAVTLVVFTAVQFAMRAVRGYLIAPLHAIIPAGNNLPGAWIYSTQVVNAAGHPVQGLPLARGSIPHGLKELVTYQPASRFWLFQGYETAIYVLLAVGLAAVCVWLIRRRLA